MGIINTLTASRKHKIKIIIMALKLFPLLMGASPKYLLETKKELQSLSDMRLDEVYGQVMQDLPEEMHKMSIGIAQLTKSLLETSNKL